MTSVTKKWNEVRPKVGKVSKSYEAAYKNPIKLKVGEIVTINQHEEKEAWPGWIYCADSRGIVGWVSEKNLSISDQTATVIKDYDATELSVHSGEKLTIYYEESEWCWCRNSAGLKGWVPTKNLDVV